jgi:hypothetical protein
VTQERVLVEPAARTVPKNHKARFNSHP